MKKFVIIIATLISLTMVGGSTASAKRTYHKTSSYWTTRAKNKKTYVKKTNRVYHHTAKYLAKHNKK